MGMKDKLKTALEMYMYFCRIGWFTFGGGWSIVAQMEKDFVDSQKRVTSEELLDLVSVGRSLPGTMIGNVAYLFGYSQGGVLAGVLGVLGMITPPFVILVALTYCYTAVRGNVYAARMLTGVRAAVVPIILSAAMKLRKGAFPKPVCYAICIAGCVLSAVFDVNCVFIVVMGIVIGLLLGGKEERGE